MTVSILELLDATIIAFGLGATINELLRKL